MKLLDLLERSVERVIQAPIDSIFRQDIQPAEIERHLERAMLDNRRRASGANIMPNAYRVELSADDYTTIEGYKASLIRRLESWLADKADEHNGTLLDRIEVDIVSGARARRRRPVIEATITDISSSATPPQARRAAAAPQRTEAYHVASTSVCTFRLLTGPNAGTTYSIPSGQSRLGRATDADIHLDASDVSRHHLRIDRNGQQVMITDLDSTNGTRVNGDVIHQTTLRNGDEVVVGTQILRFTCS